MSLALTQAIHAVLCAGEPSGQPVAPYNGFMVPHNDVLQLPDEWELVPDTEYNPDDVPSFLSLATPFYIPGSEGDGIGGLGGIYVATPDPCGFWVGSYFAIQRREI